ncbi:hypothetical protein LTR28_006763, partial [Elasticomyces elasticus]
ILESIDANTLLASFIVTRKGSAAADSGAFDPQKEFYEPITVQISVDKPNPTLLDAFQRSVKAVDEVRTHMVETMRRCSRAPEVYLPLRLPYVGTDDAGKGRQTREASVISGKQDAASIVVDPQKATAEKEPSSALVTEKRASGRRKTILSHGHGISSLGNFRAILGYSPIHQLHLQNRRAASGTSTSHKRPPPGLTNSALARQPDHYQLIAPLHTPNQTNPNSTKTNEHAPPPTSPPPPPRPHASTLHVQNAEPIFSTLLERYKDGITVVRTEREGGSGAESDMGRGWNGCVGAG